MNGDGDDYNTRLRRVEDIVEAVAMNQRQLLTAQVLLTGQVEKTQVQVEKTQIQIEKTQKQIEETNRTVANLGVRIDQVDAQIEALIKIVDGIIRG